MLTTKHNLGVSGTGAIRASTEKQLCVFCDTPHVPMENAAAQLWNRPGTHSAYTLYSSDYLTSLTYDAPDQPKQQSKADRDNADRTRGDVQHRAQPNGAAARAQ